MKADIIVRNAMVIDGTGSPVRHCELVIENGRITAVIEDGNALPKDIHADHEIDATDLLVTPGFIDIHSHSDYTLLVDPRALSSIAQGVTLEVIGNCGWGCQPISDITLSQEIIYGFDKSVELIWRTTGEYLDRLAAAQPAVNVATLVPNGQLRMATVGTADRSATADDLARMSCLLAAGLEAGAFGYSTGLEYATERSASEAEVMELCRVCATSGGFYATHTRNRDEGAVEAVAEAIRTADTGGVRLQISHLTPRRGRDDLDCCIDLVDAARRDGQDVSFDMHTRLFGTLALKNVLPQWAFEDGKSALVARLNNPDARQRMKSHRSIISALADWERVVLLECKARPELARRSIANIALQWDCEPFEAVYDILLAEIEQIESHPMVILLSYTEELLSRTYQHPHCMVGSDATALCPDGPLAGASFHGAYTWASWFYRRMVRETKVFTAEEAIHKITGMPARVLGLKDRGVIRAGASADLAIFDPATFGETGTTFEPNQLAIGMKHVIVNGKIGIRDGKITGERSGQVLRRA
jgi:N-acyl-D-amino-acid deacylase